MVYYSIYRCPFCDFLIASTEKGLCSIELDMDNAGSFFKFIESFGEVEKNPEKNSMYKSALDSYFKGDLKKFNVPLNLKGTPFQIRVWNELIRIPYGEVRTYGDIAKFTNSSPRAIGQAVKRNPVPIVIPCHRVVSASGIGGFGGQTAGKNIFTKKRLLEIEGFNIDSWIHRGRINKSYI